ncbi:MAG: endonuclease I [Glaciecola sp.]|jgi:endonuclease I
MKKTLLFVFIPLLSFTQVPLDYYLTAENTRDDILKFELNQIIDDHTEFYYTSSGTDVWDILKETDKDPNNTNNVILIYSGISVNAAQEYNSGAGWTREHVWAKSKGDFGTALGPGTDVHHLRPLDNSMNSTRNNRGFDNCITCIDVYDQWSNPTGSKKDANNWSFEPRANVKGDVARMLFYMAVRYEGYDGYPDLELSETIQDQSGKLPFHGVLSTLLEWHRNDPIDSWEENRNDIIYYSYQNNRNPFIDYPELAEHLWGNMKGIDWQKSLGVDAFSEVEIKFYPNPTSLGYVNISSKNSSRMNVTVFDILGKQVINTTVSNNRLNVSNLNAGIYIMKITQGKAISTKKLVIN